MRNNIMFTQPTSLFGTVGKSSFVKAIYHDIYEILNTILTK